MELTDFEPLLVDFYSMSPIHMVSPRKLLFEGFFLACMHASNMILRKRKRDYA